MKVLFIASGNSNDFVISPIIYSQVNSIKRKGITVDRFLIRGKGVSGYLNQIKELRIVIKHNTFDLIHAHYALSGWIAVLATKNTPVICSFMGSDVYGDRNSKGRFKPISIIEVILAILIQPFLSFIIVKSENLYRYIWIKRKCSIVPNGVDISKFREFDKDESKLLLGLDLRKNYILFLGDKTNQRKNYSLFERAINNLNERNLEALSPYPIDHAKVPLYLNAVELLVVTSYREGSPNVIKEAMACNCPIVSTDVGDVNYIISETKGCYITSFELENITKTIRLALSQNDRTEGRMRIIKLKLDSISVANKIVEIYKKVLNKEENLN